MDFASPETGMTVTVSESGFVIIWAAIWTLSE